MYFTSGKDATTQRNIISEGLENLKHNKKRHLLSVGEAMACIENFLSASCTIGINPIPILELTYPHYIWQFHHGSLGDLYYIVQSSDLVWEWGTYDGKAALPMQIITAKLEGRPPSRYMFVPRDDFFAMDRARRARNLEANILTG